MIYFLSNTLPLINLLQSKCHRRTKSVYLPACMNGIQLSFFNKLPDPSYEDLQPPWMTVPTYFWRSRQIWNLPTKTKFRRMLCKEVCDSDHFEHCSDCSFHTSFSPNCVCKYCGDLLHAYHIDYQFCNKQHEDSD